MPLERRNTRRRRDTACPYPSRERLLTDQTRRRATEETLGVASSSQEMNMSGYRRIRRSAAVSQVPTVETSLGIIHAYLRKCQENITTYHDHRLNLAEMASFAYRCMNSTPIFGGNAENQHRDDELSQLNAENRSMEAGGLLNELMHCQQSISEVYKELSLFGSPLQFIPNTEHDNAPDLRGAQFQRSTNSDQQNNEQQ